MSKTVRTRRTRPVTALVVGSLLAVVACSTDAEPTPSEPVPSAPTPPERRPSGPVPTPAGKDAPTPPEVAVGDAAMVADIEPGSRGSFPADGAAVGDRLVFATFGYGPGLWVTDGSAAAPLARVVPVLDETKDGEGVVFTEMGGVLYFTGKDRTGYDLWRTDATAAGTRPVVDVADAAPSESLGGTRQLTAVGDTLYFVAHDRTNGHQLWRSDGTAAGTSVLTSQPGTDRDNAASNLTAVGDTLFFTLDEPATGRELWSSDGTAEGTRLVADIRPGETGSRPLLLTAVGDQVFFAATDATHGNELWASDGTEEGTRLVKDITPGAFDAYELDDNPDDDEPPPPFAGLEPLGVLGDSLLFSADDGTTGEEPWVSDGTAEGTRLVADLDPATVEDGIDGSDPSPAVVWKGTAYFTADDGRHGRELWRTDGTAKSTRLVADITTRAHPQYAEVAEFGPGELTKHQNRLYFSAYGNTSGGGLWRTDGTAEGTELVTDVTDVVGGSFLNAPSYLVTAGDALYFTTNDELFGPELWSTGEAATSVPRVRSTTRPRITGDVVVGGTLTADPGTFTPADGVTFSYRWYRDDMEVLGEDGLTFQPRPGDVGVVIGFRVTATSPGIRGVAVRAALTRPVRER